MVFENKSELINKMHRIVERFMKFYKSDFTDFDLKRIEQNSKSKFVWMVRECGTLLFYKKNLYCNLDSINFYLNEYGTKRLKFYELDLGNNSIKLIRDIKKYVKENITSL